MKNIRIGVAFCLALLIGALNSCSQTNQNPANNSVVDLDGRYRTMVHSEFPYRAMKHHADSRYLIIVDYSIPSNDYRMFIWDAEQDQIVKKFWCAHGFGSGSTAEKPVFSNTLGSNCSSLGCFLIDRSVGVSGKYGYKYHAVDGLDACNSNARKRELLIHTWSSVTQDYEAKISHPMYCDYRSAGCFTTTNVGYQSIDSLIKVTSKRILLWSIDGVNN